MKIGVYCTNNYPYPVPAGTIYANMTVAGELADALADLGEDVTFFAPLGTKTRAKLITFDMLPFCDRRVYPLYPDKNSSYDYEDLMMIKLLHYAKNNHFAILHTHCRPFSVYRFASLISPLPVAATVHDLLHYPGYRLLPAFQQFSNIHLISISLAQQRSNPAVKFAGNVYNGVDLSLWPFSPVHKGYLLFAGRLLKEKGVDLAVQIARASNLPLKIAGTLYPSRRRFFEAKIKPYLNDKIAYLGAVPREELPKLYGGALALLAPIRWPEPFGLIFIEAMCTGTPVVATSLGAAPEIIKDGETGFLLPKPKIDHFVEAIGKIDRISRAACRNHVQKNFTIAQTARNYLALYRKFI